MSTKIDELFATLRILIADTSRDLALAMAELRSVAQQRDNFAEALQRNCAEYVQKQQALIAERDKLRAEREAAALDALRARQSLRAAEQDLAETEGVNSDLRTVNARLVADLAAAMERLNHAESIGCGLGGLVIQACNTPKQNA